MPTQPPSVVELTVDVPDHVLVDGHALCNAPLDRHEAKIRVVDGDLPVVADASVHRCRDCFERWAAIRDDVVRASTVQCHCDRLEHGAVYRCGRVVPSFRARRLRHPDVPDGEVPVCPDCYEWIRERPGNSVSAPYEEVAAWETAEKAETDGD